MIVGMLYGLTISAPMENGKKVLTMDEYIEREAVVMGILGLTIVDPMVAQYADAVLHQIQQAPAADVAPVRHARWVDNHCTACGMMPMGDEMWKHLDLEPPLFERFMDYCPICGCRMDG